MTSVRYVLRSCFLDQGHNYTIPGGQHTKDQNGLQKWHIKDPGTIPACTIVLPVAEDIKDQAISALLNYIEKPCLVSLKKHFSGHL